MRPPKLIAAVLAVVGCLSVPSLARGQAALAPSAGQAPRSGQTPLAARGQTAVVEIEGFIQVHRAGERTRERLSQVPATLRPGDTIHTFGKGRAKVRFKDGSEVVLDNYAVLTVEQDSRDAVTINLTAGKLWAVVAKLQRRRFDVRTPVAVASVRGTTFMVEAGARRAAVEVFGGRVAVIDPKGNELLLGANQRVGVLDGRLGALERVQGRPEVPHLNPSQQGRDEQKSKESEGAEKQAEREERRAEAREHMKGELEREVSFQVMRQQIESSAAFEGKNALYQEGKSLIDAFGRRVRVEQYLTRPNPAAFRVTTLNFRDNRLDKSVFEVQANRALPENISDAGNLWFSDRGMPTWYAVKQKWTFTNGRDSVTQLAVDGKPAPIEFVAQGTPICDSSNNCTFGGNTTVASNQFFQTIFGHRYEFITSGPSASNLVMDNIYHGSARPLDDPNMMWHTQPIQVEVFDTTLNKGYTFWQDAFMVTDKVYNVGKAYVERSFHPRPGLAHFVERRDYIGFQDATGRGFLNFGDQTNVSGMPYGIANNVNVTIKRLWDGIGAPTTDGTALSPIAQTNTTLFVPNNGTFLPSGNPTFSAAGFKDPGIEGFLKTNPSNDWLVAENFIIDDFGKVFDFAAAANDPKAFSQASQGFNFERSVASSKFEGRKIDVVFDPAFFIKAGLVSADNQKNGIGR